MKKILFLLLVTLAFASADTLYVNTLGTSIAPGDVSYIELYDGVGDTVVDSNYIAFGPYKLAPAKGKDMYSGFQYFSAAGTGTTAMAYQLAMSSTVTDTAAANWVTFDTIDASGSTKYVDLTSNSAKYIYFRVHNYSATSDIMGKLQVLFKE